MKKIIALVLCFLMLTAAPLAAFAETEELTVVLPSKIYGTVNREMNIYFDNITLCNNLKSYQIDVVCDRGIQQNERWTYTPTAAETFGITINFYKNFGRTLVKSAQSQITVSATQANEAATKLLIIGDSWTDYTSYPARIRENFNADSANSCILLGTKKPWGEEVRHEGRSGWNTDDYMAASKGSTANPFYNPTTKTFDLSYYLAQNKGNLHSSNITLEDETPDVVIIFLGINDVSQVGDRSKIVSNLNTMIASIHNVSENIKIGVVLTPPPAYSQDGFGNMNKCANTRFSQKAGAIELNTLYINSFSNINNVFLVPANVNIDCVNNYNYEEVAANAYSDVIIKRATDNVHPAAAGFYQCADAIYAAIKANCK